jgi:hypothetical protein
MRIVGLLTCAFAFGCSISAQRQEESRPTPEAAALAMVDTALPADWVGGFENLGALSQDDVKEPAGQLISVSQKFGKVSDFEGAMSVLKYRAYIRPLFKDGKVQVDKLTLYNSRLQGLSLEAFGEWSAALKAKCSDTPDWMAAFELMQVESFWSGDKATDATRKRTLARLSSVAAFEGWSPASNCSDNVMYILQIEPLFVEDRFDAELFARALPLANELYKKRSADQEARRAAEREKK